MKPGQFLKKHICFLSGKPDEISVEWKIFSLAVGMLHGKILLIETNPITLDLAILKDELPNPSFSWN